MKQKITTGTFEKLKLQHALSLTVVIMCFLTISINLLIGLIENYRLQDLLKNNSIWLVFFTSIPFIIDLFLLKYSRLIQFFQVIIFFISAIITIFDDYNGFFGIALWIISILLIIRYDFIKKRRIYILFVPLLLLAVTIQSSAILKDEASRTLSILLFIAFVLFLIFLIYKSQIIELINLKKKYPNDIIELEATRRELSNKTLLYMNQINELEEKISEIKMKEQPFDFSKYKLTKSEFAIIKILIKTRCSNKVIAKELNIKENTVKQHLFNVYNKIGIDTRMELIELGRFNWP